MNSIGAQQNNESESLRETLSLCNYDQAVDEAVYFFCQRLKYPGVNSISMKTLFKRRIILPCEVQYVCGCTKKELKKLLLKFPNVFCIQNDFVSLNYNYALIFLNESLKKFLPIEMKIESLLEMRNNAAYDVKYILGKNVKEFKEFLLMWKDIFIVENGCVRLNVYSETLYDAANFCVTLLNEYDGNLSVSLLISKLNIVHPELNMVLEKNFNEFENFLLLFPDKFTLHDGHVFLNAKINENLKTVSFFKAKLCKLENDWYMNMSALFDTRFHAIKEVQNVCGQNLEEFGTFLRKYPKIFFITGKNVFLNDPMKLQKAVDYFRSKLSEISPLEYFSMHNLFELRFQAPEYIKIILGSSYSKFQKVLLMYPQYFVIEKKNVILKINFDFLQKCKNFFIEKLRMYVGKGFIPITTLVDHYNEEEGTYMRCGKKVKGLENILSTFPDKFCIQAKRVILKEDILQVQNFFASELHEYKPDMFIPLNVLYGFKTNAPNQINEICGNLYTFKSLIANSSVFSVENDNVKLSKYKKTTKYNKAIDFVSTNIGSDIKSIDFLFKSTYQAPNKIKSVFGTSVADFKSFLEMNPYKFFVTENFVVLTEYKHKLQSNEEKFELSQISKPCGSHQISGQYVKSNESPRKPKQTKSRELTSQREPNLTASKVSDYSLDYQFNDTDHKIKLITSIQEARNVVDYILEVDMKFAFDLEGVNLGSAGTITLLQIALPSKHIYIFELLNTELMKEGKLKDLLQSHVHKIAHCCRGDSANLYSQFGVLVRNVFDTQVAHVVLQRQENGIAAEKVQRVSLNQLLKDYGFMPNPYKQEVTSSYNSCSVVWASRPFSENMILCVARDVADLLELGDKMKREMQPVFVSYFQYNCLKEVTFFLPEHVKKLNRTSELYLEFEKYENESFDHKISSVSSLRRPLQNTSNTYSVKEIRDKEKLNSLKRKNDQQEEEELCDFPIKKIKVEKEIGHGEEDIFIPKEIKKEVGASSDQLV